MRIINKIKKAYYLRKHRKDLKKAADIMAQQWADQIDKDILEEYIKENNERTPKHKH